MFWGGILGAIASLAVGSYVLHKDVSPAGAAAGFWLASVGTSVTTVALQVKHEDWFFHAIANRGEKLLKTLGLPCNHIDLSGQSLKHPKTTATRHNVNQLAQIATMVIMAGGFTAGLAASFGRTQINASIVMGLGLLATGVAFGLSAYRSQYTLKQRDAVRGMFSEAEAARNRAIDTLQGPATTAATPEAVTLAVV